MSSQHPSELDTDSVASSPRSEHDSHHPRVRLMCSFGGKILPRPHDNQLRYVGGDTRMVAVHRHTTFAALLNKLSKLPGTTNFSVKYQLPNEDLDALISVTTDEDVENMMEEYERVAQNQSSRSVRLRLFLFNSDSGGSGDNDSRASSISSLLDSSANREQWFLDALNSGAAAAAARIERGRSEVSSLVSEAPDYLFGLDNTEEPQPREPNPKLKIRREVSVASDPGSPAPVASSPFGSTSSAPAVPSIPELLPVKTKQENPEPVSNPNQNKTEVYTEPVEQSIIQQTGYASSPRWQYAPHTHNPGHMINQVPVYYVPSPAQTGNPPVHPVPIQMQFSPQYPVQVGHHVPIGYHQPLQVPGVGQVYGGPVRPMVVPMDSYDQSAKATSDGVNQQFYYGVKNPGFVHVNPGMVVTGSGEGQYRIDPGSNPGRMSR